MDIFKSVVTGGVIISSMLPLMTSFYIELIHILNQYKVFVAHPAKYYLIANALAFVACVLFIWLLKKKKWQISNWKKWAYPCMVIGVTFLSIQIPMQSVYNPDIFEGANYGVLISDFFNYGSIPLVEHYGGHMMTGVWEGVLYGVINNDFAGAIVSPYANIVLVALAIIFYYFIKNIWNSDIALMVTLFFPFMDYWTYYGLGMMICLAVLGYIKKKTYVRALLVWLAFIWCALYRLDLGFAFGLASIIVLIIYVLINKCWDSMRQLAITLFGCAGVGLTAWFVICGIKGINPIKRLLEFIKLSLSNQNWAYHSIGNTANTVFGNVYLVLPFVVIGCLLFVFLSREMRKKAEGIEFVILAMLGISCLINYSRGLVRHSLMEMQTGVIVWTAYVFLAYFYSCYKNNKKVFLPTFMLLMLVNTLFVQDENYNAKSIADNSVVYPEKIVESWTMPSYVGGTQTYWETIKAEETVVQRVLLSEELVKMSSQYEIVLNALLEDDETFVDFVNKTMLYAITGKKDPAYVSQSPLQLSGEFTQEQFIEQIEGVPIVVMPIDPNDYKASISMDGITNSYRYYIVSEYIYANYMPLCRYGDVYAIWCLKSRYDGYINKLNSLMLNTTDANVGTIDYGYDGPYEKVDDNENVIYAYRAGIHNYDVNQLPWIWANYDLEKVSDGKVVTETEYKDGLYHINEGAVDYTNAGTYLKIHAIYNGYDNGTLYKDDDEIVWTTVVMGKYENGEFAEKAKYKMGIKEGESDYLIRVSADYYWYLGEVNAIKILPEGNVYGVDVTVVEE
jgi:hypothetical protein